MVNTFLLVLLSLIWLTAAMWYLLFIVYICTYVEWPSPAHVCLKQLCMLTNRTLGCCDSYLFKIPIKFHDLIPCPTSAPSPTCQVRLAITSHKRKLSQSGLHEIWWALVKVVDLVKIRRAHHSPKKGGIPWTAQSHISPLSLEVICKHEINMHHLGHS